MHPTCLLPCDRVDPVSCHQSWARLFPKVTLSLGSLLLRLEPASFLGRSKRHAFPLLAHPFLRPAPSYRHPHFLNFALFLFFTLSCLLPQFFGHPPPGTLCKDNHPCYIGKPPLTYDSRVHAPLCDIKIISFCSSSDLPLLLFFLLSSSSVASSTLSSLSTSIRASLLARCASQCGSASTTTAPAGQHEAPTLPTTGAAVTLIHSADCKAAFPLRKISYLTFQVTTTHNKHTTRATSKSRHFFVGFATCSASYARDTAFNALASIVFFFSVA